MTPERRTWRQQVVQQQVWYPEVAWRHLKPALSYLRISGLQLTHHDLQVHQNMKERNTQVQQRYPGWLVGFSWVFGVSRWFMLVRSWILILGQGRALMLQHRLASMNHCFMPDD